MRLKLPGLYAVLILALAATLPGCGMNEAGSERPGPRVTGGPGSICGSGLDGGAGQVSGIKRLDGAATTLSGAGATFPAPLYSLWAGAYKEAAGVEVAYQSIGSGGGVRQIVEGTVDFGASDAPMKDSELAAAKGGPVLHVPTVFGAVVATYNVPGAGEALNFSADVLGKIYSGAITNWDHPEIAELNPEASFPAIPIAVVHRSDGSGTTDIWTSYLAEASPFWVSALGGRERASGKEVAWPVGIGGKGNEGVSAAVGQIRGSIGYVELSYALEQELAFGRILNRAGKFVLPCIETVTAAAEEAETPADLRFKLVDQPGENAYPVTGATWLLVYQHQRDPAVAKALVNFLSWAMGEGQRLAPDLNYAPLSQSVRASAIEAIRRIESGGFAVAQ